MRDLYFQTLKSLNGNPWPVLLVSQSENVKIGEKIVIFTIIPSGSYNGACGFFAEDAGFPCMRVAAGGEFVAYTTKQALRFLEEWFQ